jgi:hypothetical protein
VRHASDSRHSVQARFANGFARSVELICARCNQKAVFEASPWQEHGRQIVATEITCTRCEFEALLVQFARRIQQLQAGFVVHLPGPWRARQHVGCPSPADAVRTARAQLRLRLEAVQPREWGPAALTVRHLLEGLSARLLSADKRELPLTRQLEALPRDLDLTKPLQDIAHLMASDGAFGRHFDDEAAIDRATAEHLLDLTEQLIQYLVVLPAELAELKGRIATAPVPLPLRRGSGAA